MPAARSSAPCACRRPTPILVPFVQRIRDAKPDVAFLWIPSIQATALMKAVKDLELREAGIHITSAQDLLPDEQMPAIGDSALDLITAGTYSIAGKRPANEPFSPPGSAPMAKSVIPDFLSVDAWDGMVAIFDLIKATNGKFTADERWSSSRTGRTPTARAGLS